MWSKLTAYILTAFVGIIGAPILGHLAQVELAKDKPGLSVVACMLVILVAVLLINICTDVTRSRT